MESSAQVWALAPMEGHINVHKYKQLNIIIVRGKKKIQYMWLHGLAISFM